MSSLKEILGQSPKRAGVVADAVSVLDQEVADKASSRASSPTWWMACSTTSSTPSSPFIEKPSSGRNLPDVTWRQIAIGQPMRCSPSPTPERPGPNTPWCRRPTKSSGRPPRSMSLRRARVWVSCWIGTSPESSPGLADAHPLRVSSGLRWSQGWLPAGRFAPRAATPRERARALAKPGTHPRRWIDRICRVFRRYPGEPPGRNASCREAPFWRDSAAGMD